MKGVVEMKAPRLTSTGLVVAIATTLLVGGVVVAGAHGGGPTNKVIHACVDDKTGSIWIVDQNSGCGQDGHPLDWNGEGPRGKQGPPGPQGPPGDTGFASTTVVTATNSVASSATTAVTVPWVGVDCPGDSTATGGGGYTSSQNTLVASVPLEANSNTDNFAETGDRPTGWFAAGSPPITVYAVCTAASPTPPHDEDD